jgi:hypothetical protein
MIMSNPDNTTPDDNNIEIAGTIGTVGGYDVSKLLIFEQAKRALAAVSTVEEVKAIRAQACGLVAYAKKASDRHLQADADAIRMEAELRLGQMMKEQKAAVGLNKGGRPKTGLFENPVSPPKPTLAEAGIDKNLANRARSFAAMPEEEFQQAVEAKRAAIQTPTPKPKRPRRSSAQVKLEPADFIEAYGGDRLPAVWRVK